MRAISGEHVRRRGGGQWAERQRRRRGSRATDRTTMREPLDEGESGLTATITTSTRSSQTHWGRDADHRGKKASGQERKASTCNGNDPFLWFLAQTDLIKVHPEPGDALGAVQGAPSDSPSYKTRAHNRPPTDNPPSSPFAPHPAPPVLVHLPSPPHSTTTITITTKSPCPHPQAYIATTRRLQSSFSSAGLTIQAFLPIPSHPFDLQSSLLI